MARRRKKEPQKKELSFRVNERIRVPEVRLVGDNLEQLSQLIGDTIGPDIYPTHVVKKWALKMELDLVEISPKAKPPVVKIIDYNKFLYDRKKKEKEMKANAAKTVVKEIRFGPNTEDHDFNFKISHAKKFLEEGAKVKAHVHFRGRTIVFKDRGELLLLRFIKELEEEGYGTPEALPKMEGRRMGVTVNPKKKKK